MVAGSTRLTHAEETKLHQPLDDRVAGLKKTFLKALSGETMVLPFVTISRARSLDPEARGKSFDRANPPMVTELSIKIIKPSSSSPHIFNNIPDACAALTAWVITEAALIKKKEGEFYQVLRDARVVKFTLSTGEFKKGALGSRVSSYVVS